MKNNMIELYKSFLNIKDMGWIESSSIGYGAAGVMFEKLLGLTNNKFEIPDFNGIEIKTKRMLSKSFISLFCSAPDGAYLFSTKEIVNKYGWPDKNFKSANVLFCDVYGNKKTDVGIKYKMKLSVNYDRKRVYLLIYSKKNDTLLSSNDYYWSFEVLEEKLIRKLDLLALVYVKSKVVENRSFYYYYKLKFYKLVSFERFCELIDIGIVKVSFKVGVKIINKNVKIVDHGTSFSISTDNLERLFFSL